MPVIRIVDTDIEVHTQPGEPILAALMRAGYSYIVGCKRGGCGICKLDIEEGGVEYPIAVADAVLPEQDRPAIALSCRAVPSADVTLRMDPTSKFRVVSPFFAALAKASQATRQATRATVAGAVTGASGAAASTAATAATATTSAALAGLSRQARAAEAARAARDASRRSRPTPSTQPSEPTTDDESR